MPVWASIATYALLALYVVLPIVQAIVLTRRRYGGAALLFALAGYLIPPALLLYGMVFGMGVSLAEPLGWTVLAAFVALPLAPVLIFVFAMRHKA
ncbi:MAG: hypothetical protein J0L81_00240 [Caulobacterales bacterium]|jgi:hypothetical protein|nr:hypothetical protein [Caulobacterales bacterium]